MWFWSLFIVVPLFCYCCALFLAIAGLFVWLLHECCCHYYVVKRRTLWHAALNDWRCLVIPMLCVTKSSMSLCFWPFHKPFCLLPNLWCKNNLAKEICVTLTHYCFLQMLLCCEVCFVYVIRVHTACCVWWCSDTHDRHCAPMLSRLLSMVQLTGLDYGNICGFVKKYWESLLLTLFY